MAKKHTSYPLKGDKEIWKIVHELRSLADKLEAFMLMKAISYISKEGVPTISVSVPKVKKTKDK